MTRLISESPFRVARPLGRLHRMLDEPLEKEQSREKSHIIGGYYVVMIGPIHTP